MDTPDKLLMYETLRACLCAAYGEEKVAALLNPNNLGEIVGRKLAHDQGLDDWRLPTIADSVGYQSAKHAALNAQYEDILDGLEALAELERDGDVKIAYETDDLSKGLGAAGATVGAVGGGTVGAGVGGIIGGLSGLAHAKNPLTGAIVGGLGGTIVGGAAGASAGGVLGGLDGYVSGANMKALGSRPENAARDGALFHGTGSAILGGMSGAALAGPGRRGRGALLGAAGLGTLGAAGGALRGSVYDSHFREPTLLEKLKGMF